jgi:ABC-type phosphate transport system permease subunit
VELLPAFPKVVYGLWGLFVVVPAMRSAANWFYERLGLIPFFGTTLSRPGLGPAALVLAIMVLPRVAALSQDALRLVPTGEGSRLRDGRHALGSDPEGHAALRGLLHAAVPRVGAIARRRHRPP